MFNLFTYRRSKKTLEDRKKVEQAQEMLQRRKELEKEGRFRGRSNLAGSGLTQDSRASKLAKSEGKGVYLRRYVPAAERAELNAKEFQSGHLSPTEPYNPLSPHMHYPGRFIEFFQHTEAHSRPSDQVASQRVGHSVSHSRILAYDLSTLGSAFLPNFRAREKAKEGNRKDFLPYNKEYHHEAAWSTAQMTASEPYIDGLEALGNRWKPRDKSKELSPRGFRPNHYGDILLGRGSINSLSGELSP